MSLPTTCGSVIRATVQDGTADGLRVILGRSDSPGLVWTVLSEEGNAPEFYYDEISLSDVEVLFDARSA